VVAVPVQLWSLFAGSVLADGVVVGGGVEVTSCGFSCVLCYSGTGSGVMWWWVEIFGLLFAAGGVDVGGAADLFWL
jgi:hypothetical protein